MLILVDKTGKKRPIKLGKLFKILNLDIKDWEVEEFINALKESDSDNLELVEGEKIKYYYNPQNCDGEFYSCMADEDKSKFLDIYSKNPNQVKMLVLKNEKGKAEGRALVWKLDSGDLAMDRIYTSNENKSKFYTYANKNNILTSIPEGAEVTLDNKGEYEFYPYVDTLSYYDPESGIMTNIEQEEPWLHLISTDGSSTPANSVWSEINQEYIAGDEVVYDENLDDYIYENQTKESFITEKSYYEKDMIKIELVNKSFYDVYNYDYDIYVHEEIDSEYYLYTEMDAYQKFPVLVNHEYGVEYDYENNRIIANQEFEKIVLKNKFRTNKKDSYFSYRKFDEETGEEEFYLVEDCNILINSDGEIEILYQEDVENDYDKYEIVSPIYYDGYLIFNEIYIHEDSDLMYSVFEKEISKKEEMFKVAEGWYENKSNQKYFKKVDGGYIKLYHNDKINSSDEINESLKYKESDLKLYRDIFFVLRDLIELDDFEDIEYSLINNPVYFDYKDYKIFPVFLKGSVLVYTGGRTIIVKIENIKDLK
jgi:hypothetical protein